MNILTQCPKCGSYGLSSRIEYNIGNPSIHYTCDSCGYSSSNEYYTTDNKTTVSSNCIIISNTTNYQGEYV